MRVDKKQAFKYINEYQKQKYDRITITRNKGDKEKLQKVAAEKDLSLNAFINACIDEKLKRMKIDL